MPASKIAVIETRLPYTDRRALSQAWFSALHLAADRDPGRALAIAHRRDPERPARGRDAATPTTAHLSGGGAMTSATRAGAMRPGCRPVVEIPQRRSSDGRSLARDAQFARARSYPPFRTSLTLEAAGGVRVHLIVRRVGAALHVVALCPPSAETVVRRALASADLHFRARGDRMHVDVAGAHDR